MENKGKEIILDTFSKKVFDLLEEAVVVYRPINNGSNFVFVYVNKAVERIEKVKKKDLIAKKIDECFPGVKELGLFNIMQEVYRDGKKRNDSMKLYKDGRIEGFRKNTVQRLANKDLLVIYSDLSAEKKQEEKLKEKEKEAQEANLDWSETFDAMSDGISIHTPDFTVLNVNQSLCDILNVKKEEIIGQKCFKFFHKTSEPIKECPMKKALETKQRAYAEIYEKTLNTWVSISISPVLKNGKIEKVIHSVRDISERKNNEQEIIRSRERLDNILHSIGVGVVIIDVLKHEIMDINQMAADMIGLPIKKIIGNICHKFICPAQVGACPITDLGQKIDHSEKTLIDKNGKAIPIYKTVIETNLEGRRVLIESFIDISAQKEANNSLNAKNKQLEKFNKLAVDRELKMIDLKKKIKKFEKKFNEI